MRAALSGRLRAFAATLRRGPRRTLAVAAAALLVGLVAPVLNAVGTGCGTVRTVPVAAAPDIAPALRAAATRFNADRPRVDGECVRITVTGTEPASVAAALTGSRLDTGGARPVPVTPAGWVPDSALWLDRVRGQAPEQVDGSARSIASSPVVLAMPTSSARALGWPAARPAWSDWVGPAATGPVSLATTDPRRDAAALAALTMIRDAAGTRLLDTFQALAGRVATGRADLLRRLPAGPTPEATGPSSGGAAGTGAAPLPEQAVIAHDASHPAVPLAMVGADPAAAALDYPFAVLPSASEPDAAAAVRFRAALRADRAYRDLLTGHGFRTPGGQIGPGFRTGYGASGAPFDAPAPPSAADRDDALHAWARVAAPARVITLLDTSGSMSRPPGGDPTDPDRLALAASGARQAVSRLADASSAGVWTAGQDTGADHREPAPLAPLSAGRGTVSTALDGAHPAPDDGATADIGHALPAALSALLAGWRPGTSNEIVLLTDGCSGVDGTALRAELEHRAMPGRPVRIITVGTGSEVDRDGLRAIAAATGGDWSVATDPSTIAERYLDGLQPTG